MAVRHGYGKIATDGLKVAFDAFESLSATSGSTTVKNLAGSEDSVLENGAYFSPEDKAFMFDGTNDYATQTYDMSGLSEFSLEFWAKSYETGSAEENYLHALAGPNGGGSYVRINQQKVGYERINILFYVSGNESNVFAQALINYDTYDPFGYNHYLVTIKDNDYQRIYFNGEVKINTSIGSVLTTGLNTWYQRWGNYANSYKWNGEIAVAKIYNRALTAEEVLQNYNATKTRFGL
jgi:hypothetical protein